MKKIINIITIVLLILIIFSNFCQVFSATESDIRTYYSGQKSGMSGQDKVNKIINIIIGAIQVVGVFVAVAFLIFIGIKYMVAKKKKKADIKKHLVAYVVGAMVMFGTAGILEIIEIFADKATS